MRFNLPPLVHVNGYFHMTATSDGENPMEVVFGSKDIPVRGNQRSSSLHPKKQEELLGGQDNALILSFFFHGGGVDLQKTPLGCYRSLLHQILCQAPGTLFPLIEEFKRKKKRRISWEWQENELQGFFKSSLPTILETHSIWLYVDALDECGERKAVNLFEEFKSLVHGSLSTTLKFHICISCRHYPILDPGYIPHICSEGENADDITKYIRSRMSSAPELAASSISRSIAKKVSGIFMWAQLAVELALQRNRNAERLDVIEEKINNISSGLDNIYLSLVGEMIDKEIS